MYYAVLTTTKNTAPASENKPFGSRPPYNCVFVFQAR